MSHAHLYGLLAEFSDTETLIDAVMRARRERSYSALEAYSPFPVPGLHDALGAPRNHIALAMLLGGIVAGAGTFALEWYSAVVDYPINVGGRPTGSWQAFLPAAIEMTVLGAVICGVIVMLISNALPRWHHPNFGIDAFSGASDDRFFLLLRSDDPNFDAPSAREFFETLGCSSISEVPA